ncbi:MAG: hypothetical protein AB1634_10075 [Thermodesulfobacteriota bacterium]
MTVATLPPDWPALLAAWPAGQPELARALRRLVVAASRLPGTTLGLVTRPGVSASLRAGLAAPPAGRSRPLYFLVDVVMLAQDPWFLSACFYADEVSDPLGLGNAIPQGLFQETGYCFDVEGEDATLLGYLEDRIQEAYGRAGQG